MIRWVLFIYSAVGKNKSVAQEPRCERTPSKSSTWDKTEQEVWGKYILVNWLLASLLTIFKVYSLSFSFHFISFRFVYFILFFGGETILSDSSAFSLFQTTCNLRTIMLIGAALPIVAVVEVVVVVMVDCCSVDCFLFFVCFVRHVF